MEAYDQAAGGSSSAAGPAAAATSTEADGADAVPRMPVAPCVHDHRQQLADCEPPFSALVARPVGKAEVRSTPAAQAALLKEWDKLRKAGCWDEGAVCEWAAVAAKARKTGSKAHVGMIFEICVEKGCPETTPRGSSKGESSSRATT